MGIVQSLLLVLLVKLPTTNIAGNLRALNFMEEITKYLDSGYPIDILYLDFKKAFDEVPHCMLVSKLAAHRISGDVLRWIENWLSGRK